MTVSATPQYVPVTVGLIKEPNGVAAWRIAYPFTELATQGAVVAWAEVGTEKAAQYITWAEAVVSERCEWHQGDEDKAEKFIEMLHSEGRTYIHDCDDDLYSPDVRTRIRRTGDAELNARSDAQLERERQSRIFALRLADGVTCSTEYLASVVRGYTSKPVVVVPNAIDLPRFQAGMGERTKDWPLTIGWAGGNRPNEDAKQLATAWSRVADRYSHVRFLVGGFRLEELIRAVPEDRLTVVPKQPLSTYPRIFGHIDIGCAPLNDETFNRSKSPIKAMEFAAGGAAVCASPLVYNTLVRDGITGFLCETSDHWETALSALVEDEVLRREMAKMLLDEVERDHVLQDQAYKWPEAWRAIVADFRSQSDLAAVVGGRSR
jgi:glycosyltransferase involved in cell wall biosynthesis